MNNKENDSTYISVFTPSQTNAEDLEAIFVQRENLLNDVLERVVLSAKTKNKHHQLIVGSRGSGKTHLVTLLIHRLNKAKDVQTKLKIAWLNEDETFVSLLDILLHVFTSLNKRYAKAYLISEIEGVYDKTPDDAEIFLSELLVQKLEKSKSTCLIIIENLDALFESIGDKGQKKLRAFLQENPLFTIFATAQKLTDDLKDRKGPFFGFFQTEHLNALTESEASELIGKIAELNNNSGVTEFLNTQKGKARIKALHHLSGGNHRMYIVLSQFISKDSIDALVPPFLKMVDELTPYYQERVRWLPPLQRKVIELLCSSRNTQSVKSIAKRLFSTNQTISSQLGELKDKGYVKSHKRGRESLYEITEPLMRICVEVKENQSNQPIEILVNFIKSWYDARDIKSKLSGVNITNTSHIYLKAALDKVSGDNKFEESILLKNKLKTSSIMENKKIIESDNSSVEEIVNTLFKETIIYFERFEYTKARSYLTKLIDILGVPNNKIVEALILRGIIYGRDGDFDNEISDYKRVLDMPDVAIEQTVQAMRCLGDSYGQQREYDKAITEYTRIIGLPGAPSDLMISTLICRGMTLCKSGELDKGLSDYKDVIEMNDASTEQVAEALIHRGRSFGENGELDKEIADYTEVIDMDDTSLEHFIEAFGSRADTYAIQNRLDEALIDFTRIIEMADVKIGFIGSALFGRGQVFIKKGDFNKGLSDFSQIINTEDIPLELVAKALEKRGYILYEQGQFDEALLDLSCVIDMEGASLETVFESLITRGLIFKEQGKLNEALSDFKRVINTPEVPQDIVDQVLLWRSAVYYEQDLLEKAESDCTRIIEVSDSSFKLLALLCRGSVYIHLKEYEKSLKDFKYIIDSSDLNDMEFLTDAYMFSAEVYISQNNWVEALKFISDGLKTGYKNKISNDYNAEDILKKVFDLNLSILERKEKISDLVSLFEKNKVALSALGAGLISHLGYININDSIPLKDNLNSWLESWEEATKDIESMSVSMRMFRVGIAFLKSDDNDDSILLDLIESERQILRQTFELDKKIV